MSQVLSQSEVDALLAAVSDGGVDELDNQGGGGGGGGGSPAAKANQNENIVVYDLTSQDRII
ncbi:MAG: flagellar motor switch protein FliM, partial [Bdellovibrionales bacterium]|nr:flagellar motor switch protein FliM [Bdellovibrionales bacterium]